MAGFGSIDFFALPRDAQAQLVRQFAATVAAPTPRGKLIGFLATAFAACGFEMPGIDHDRPLAEQDLGAMIDCEAIIEECADAVLAVLAAHDMRLEDGLQ